MRRPLCQIFAVGFNIPNYSVRFAIVMLGMALLAGAEVRQLRPGFNLFSVRQDVELGEEASHEITKEMAVVRDREVDAYLAVILAKLERSQYARTLSSGETRDPQFPFSIRLVYDKKINAFSLPGGPLFVNTGAIVAADNEAQLAGVMAHEMSHVVLR